MTCSSTQPCSETLEIFQTDPTSSALAMSARLRSNSMATSFQPVVFSLGNPPLLAPLIPVQKTTPKKLKKQPYPPKHKTAIAFSKAKKLSEKKKETFPRCAFLQTWWVDPNRSLVMKGIFFDNPPPGPPSASSMDGLFLHRLKGIIGRAHGIHLSLAFYRGEKRLPFWPKMSGETQ